MTPELDDDRIGELLRGDAPPAHDPMFRLGVMERRERKRFRNHALQMLGLGLAVILASLIAIAMGAQVFDVAGIVVIASVAAGYLLYSPQVEQILRRFRN